MVKTIYHFFRLIRTVNLLVIGLTMVVMEMFIESYINPTATSNLGNFLDPSFSLFIWLVISTILIAAAGNIINDYFDVKADRINKPDRLIIGKHIKRRWAMVLHWSLSSIGMLIALYVGYVLQNIWVPLVAFLSINTLWFYSVYFKRTALVGNLMVSLLLGIVPVYVLILWITEVIESESRYFIVIIIMFVSAIAFLMNLLRELIKDIQDVRGDVRLGGNTFPIKFGVKKTKWLIAIISVITIIIVLSYFYIILTAVAMFSFFGLENDLDLNYVLGLIFGATIFFLLSIFSTLFAKKIKTYKMASALLKVAMLFGLLTPLFL